MNGVAPIEKQRALARVWPMPYISVSATQRFFAGGSVAPSRRDMTIADGRRNSTANGINSFDLQQSSGINFTAVLDGDVL